MVNGLKTLSEGGAAMWKRPLVGGTNSVLDDQSRGRTASWDESRPPQSESSIAPENHEREEKKREKHKNTKRGEIHVSEEIKKATTQTPQTDPVPEHANRLY